MRKQKNATKTKGGNLSEGHDISRSGKIMIVHLLEYMLAGAVIIAYPVSVILLIIGTRENEGNEK